VRVSKKKRASNLTQEMGKKGAAGAGGVDVLKSEGKVSPRGLQKKKRGAYSVSRRNPSPYLADRTLGEIERGGGASQSNERSQWNMGGGVATILIRKKAGGERNYSD